MSQWVSFLRLRTTQEIGWTRVFAEPSAWHAEDWCAALQVRLLRGCGKEGVSEQSQVREKGRGIRLLSHLLLGRCSRPVCEVLHSWVCTCACWGGPHSPPGSWGQQVWPLLEGSQVVSRWHPQTR